MTGQLREHYSPKWHIVDRRLDRIDQGRKYGALVNNGSGIIAVIYPDASETFSYLNDTEAPQDPLHDRSREQLADILHTGANELINNQVL